MPRQGAGEVAFTGAGEFAKRDFERNLMPVFMQTRQLDGLLSDMFLSGLNGALYSCPAEVAQVLRHQPGEMP